MANTLASVRAAAQEVAKLGQLLRIGGATGRGLRYSYRNLNPRWLPEGAASGWAWLFS